MAMQYSISTYIALYLQAEGSCAMPQWGTLRVTYVPAEWQNKQLQAPQQQLTWEADSLVNNNFIVRLANDTQTNQAIVEKAYFNWLKEVQETINLGKEYAMAELGSWQQQNMVVGWTSSALFNTSTQATWPTGLSIEDASSPTNDSDAEEIVNDSNNTWLYIALALLLLTLAGGLYWYNQNNAIEPQAEPNEISTPPVIDTTPIDTSATTKIDTTATATMPATSGDSNRYDVVVYHYSSEQRAQKQAKKFVRNLNDSWVVLGADSQYLVIIRAVTTQTDTQRVVDSIRCFFNPKGHLYILK